MALADLFDRAPTDDGGETLATDDQHFTPHPSDPLTAYTTKSFDTWFLEQFESSGGEIPEMTDKQFDNWIARYKEAHVRPGREWYYIGTSHLTTICAIPVERLQRNMFGPDHSTKLTLGALNLNQQELGVAEFVMIASLLELSPSLTHLSLSSNYITNVRHSSDAPVFDGVQALANALEVSTTLKRVDLACCNLCGADGSRYEGLEMISHACLENHTLTCLDLQGNKIPNKKANRMLLLHAGAATQKVMSRLKVGAFSVLGVGVVGQVRVLPRPREPLLRSLVHRLSIVRASFVRRSRCRCCCCAVVAALAIAHWRAACRLLISTVRCCRARAARRWRRTRRTPACRATTSRHSTRTYSTSSCEAGAVRDRVR